MTIQYKRCGAAVALAASILLSACGGSHHGAGDAVTTAPVTPPVTSEVPASATQSALGFISYLQALVLSMADLLEPVDTSLVVAPLDDTGEPVAVN